MNTKSQENEYIEFADITLKPLKYALLYFAAFYFASNPSQLSIVLVEYLKIPPKVCFSVIELGMPFVIATVLADIVSSFLSFRYIKLFKRIIQPFKIILLILFFPLIIISIVLLKLAEIITRRKLGLVKLERYFNNRTNMKVKEVKDKSTIREGMKGYLFIVIFILSIASLFLSYLGSNIISNLWLSKYNVHLVAVSNTHYYCQIKANYSIDQCSYWKKILKELESSKER